MEISYCKFNPTGNITLIAETPVLRESQAAVAAKLMALDKGAEQVGFIEKPSDGRCEMRLQMMGGEFCGNATISAAALAMKKRNPAVGDKEDVFLEVSGADETLCVSVECVGENSFSGTVSMPLPESNFDCELLYGGKSFTLPVIRMPGICHAIVTGGISPALAEKAIGEWCRQLNAEALGIMFYNEEQKLLNPLVYVASTQSTVWESSCASGSCAVAAFESFKSGESTSLSLKQPGGTLTVKSFCKSGALFDITLTGTAELCGEYSAVIDS